MFDLGLLSAAGLEAEAPPSLPEQEIAGSRLCCWKHFGRKAWNPSWKPSVLPDTPASSLSC